MSQVTPQSEPSPGRGLPLSAATALLLAVVVSLGVFWLTSSGESPVSDRLDLASGDVAVPVDGGDETPVTIAAPEPVSNSGDEVAAIEEPAVVTATTVAPAAPLGGFGGDAAGSAEFSVLSMASDITNMGPTEIGFVTNFPQVGYEWQRVEIPLEGAFDVVWLGELNGNLVAVSTVWSDGFGAEAHRVVTSVSGDGLDWQLAGSYDLPDGSWISRVVSDGERIYAFADSWDEATRSNNTVLYTSSDGVSWEASGLDLRSGSGEHVYVQNAAAGPAGLAMAVSFESYPEEEPALLDFGEVQVLVDHRSNSYTLIDTETGDELLSGSLDDIYGWSEDGQTIYHPDTGELLTTVPWETWENAFNRFYEGYGGGGSPLPLPIGSNEPEAPPSITIEHDGFVIVIDDYAYEFSISDAETGEVIASGSLEYVYQNPPPRFVDPDSGEVLLDVTWDEWYRAEEESYRQLESSHYEYTSRTELMTSVDGASWDSTEIPTRQGAHVSYLVPTESGFVAMVNAYSEFGDQRSVWSLQDGVWTSTEADSTDLWLYQVAEANGDFFGVGDGSGGPALWSSSNGVDWTSEFAIVPQDDGSYVSLSAVAADDNGTVAALARREKWDEYRPLVVEKDGYTLTFEEGDIALRIVDSAGVEVLALSWFAFEDGTADDIITWDDGTTYISLDSGEVIAIPDDEARAAMEATWAGQGELGLSVFLREGATWAEAIVEVDGGMSGGNQLLMIDGRIIIGGAYWEGGGERYYESEFAASGSFVVIVGTPMGG